jgi:hypothetical protein
MRTIRTKVYQFSELSEPAKDKAVEKLYDINTDYEWWDLTEDEETGKLIQQGFKDAKIMFSGFSSQGDGACFTCSSIDFDIFLNGKYKGLDISANITHSWRHYFATSTTVNLYDESSLADLSEDKYDTIQKDIENERERLGNEIYRTLEKEHEYLTSEPAIIESIESNEYEFTKDGELFHK